MKSSVTTTIFVTIIFILFNCNYLFAERIIIIEQPKSITECQGKAVTLSVVAQSDENLKLNYQWYKDNKLIPDAITPYLSFAVLNYEHSGTYFCRIKVENSDESIDSHLAVIYILGNTIITKQPKDIKLNKNFEDNVIILSFDAHINGVSINEAKINNEIVKINWFVITEKGNLFLNDDETYTGSKSNNLSIKSENIKDTSYYFAVIEGKCGIDSTRIVSVIKNSKDLILNIEIEDLDAC